MARFTPGGLGEAILTALADQPFILDDLTAHLVHTGARKARKAKFVVREMRRIGLVEGPHEIELTEAGRRALDQIRRGEPLEFAPPSPAIPIPDGASFRVFGQREAA